MYQADMRECICVTAMLTVAVRVQLLGLIFQVTKVSRARRASLDNAVHLVVEGSKETEVLTVLQAGTASLALQDSAGFLAQTDGLDFPGVVETTACLVYQGLTARLVRRAETVVEAHLDRLASREE